MEIHEEFLVFLGQCMGKERDAWDSFVKKYSNLMYLYIIRTLKRYSHPVQYEEVDEVFNSIFLALLENDCKRMRSFRGRTEQSFVAYLREICFHMTIDFLRRQKPFVDIEKVQYCVSARDNYNGVDYRDLKQIIGIIKAELPERHRYLFNLMYEEDLASSEIAYIMGINLNALHQLKFRMMKNFVKIAKRKRLYHELKTFVHLQAPIMVGLNEIGSVT